VVSRQGKEAVIAILGTGDFFGEGCLAGQPTRMASAVAMPECSTMRLLSFSGEWQRDLVVASAVLFIASLSWRNTSWCQ
jgi:hypothetical protein